MKRNLFSGIVAAALIFTFAACDSETGDVGINASTLARPNNVVVSLHANIDTIIVNWDAAANYAESYEIVIQQEGKKTVRVVQPNATMRGGRFTVSGTTVTPNTASNDSDQWSVQIDDNSYGFTGAARVGVRTMAPTTAASATRASSAIRWATTTVNVKRDPS